MSAPHNITIRSIGITDLDAYKAIHLEAVKLKPTAFGGSYEDEVKLPRSFYGSGLDVDDGYDVEITVASLSPAGGFLGRAFGLEPLLSPKIKLIHCKKRMCS